ncbi:MAG: glycosyltransferase [Anaerolineales bacterium]
MKLSIVHPMDPCIQGLGGFNTCIDGVLRYAPDTWDLELIGVTRDPDARPAGRWTPLEFGGRRIQFYPSLVETEPDKVRPVPLSLRFVLACRARRVRPSGDVVQFHRPESGYAMRLTGRQQAVYFIHNHPEEVVSEFSDVRWRRLGWLFERVLWDRLRQADMIVVVDPRSRSWVGKKSEAFARRTHWLPQWADDRFFHAADRNTRDMDRVALRKAADLPLDLRVIGFAGRLETQKDPKLLLDAFGRVSTRRPDTALVYVGAGRMEQTIRQSAQSMGLGDRVRVIQPTPREALASVYRGFDVTVCSSGFESGPRVIFESLACGTPVASFDVGQVADLLHDATPSGAGSLVEERNSVSLADAIERILEFPVSEERVRQCRSVVADRTPRRALGALFDLYGSALKQAE